MHPKFQKDFDSHNPAALEFILRREPRSPTIPKATAFNNTMLGYKTGTNFKSSRYTFEVENRAAGYGDFGPQMLTT